MSRAAFHTTTWPNNEAGDRLAGCLTLVVLFLLATMLVSMCSGNDDPAQTAEPLPDTYAAEPGVTPEEGTLTCRPPRRSAR